MSSHIENPMSAVSHPNLLDLNKPHPCAYSSGQNPYQAHNHAANAEEHINNGLVVLAMEEHFNAAKAYMAAIERSHDESVQCPSF